MLRPGRLLPPTGLSTLGFDAGRFPPTPPACYPAPWRLPGPDFHRHGRCELMFRSDHSMHHLRTVGTRINHLGHLFDDLEQFGAVVAAFAAELHEFDGLGEQRAALRCAADSDAMPPT